jgi:hypothetical protein
MLRRVRRGVREISGRQTHGRLREVLPELRQGMPRDAETPEHVSSVTQAEINDLAEYLKSLCADAAECLRGSARSVFLPLFSTF